MAIVLDAHVAHHAVEVIDRHVERLGHLCRRQRVLRIGVQHAKRATNNGVGTVDNLFIGELAPLRILRGDIAARLSDLWQHLAGHPTLESLGLWQLRRENQRVETALVDECYTGFVGSVANCDGALIFCIYMFSKSIAGIAVPQCRGNILAPDLYEKISIMARIMHFLPCFIAVPYQGGLKI